MNVQDLESQVIGGLLLNGATPDSFEVLSTLTEEAFSVRPYKEAFKEIKRQALSKSIIDPILISNSLGAGSDAILSDATKKTWSRANLKGYAEEVRKSWINRQIVEIVKSGNSSILEAKNSDEIPNVVSGLISKLNAVTSNTEINCPVSMQDLLESYTETLEARNRGEESEQTIKFNIESLDEKLNGLNPTDLMILAARPSMGKTELALNMVRGIANDVDGVLVFSMEMESKQIIERNISATGMVSVSKLKNAKQLNDEDWARVSNGVGYLLSKNIWMVDATDLDVEQIRAISETHKRKHPNTKAIFIDYLGLIKKPKAERNDLAIEHISKSLKFMAKTLKTPVIALSQLSRKVEERPNKRPLNSDLRDSGSIEQDADVIVMIYRDEYYVENSKAKGIAELIITKNRNGEKGTVYQSFRNGHFSDVDQLEIQKTLESGREEKPKRYAKGGF